MRGVPDSGPMCVVERRDPSQTYIFRRRDKEEQECIKSPFRQSLSIHDCQIIHLQGLLETPRYLASPVSLDTLYCDSRHV